VSQSTNDCGRDSRCLRDSIHFMGLDLLQGANGKRREAVSVGQREYQKASNESTKRLHTVQAVENEG
jgi:hypothetical protein